MPWVGDAVKMEQVGRSCFWILEELKYLEEIDDGPVAPASHPSREVTIDGRAYRLHVVPRFEYSDLASVPYALWSVISPYGRQTRPSVLHDFQCVAPAEDYAVPRSRRAYEARYAADTVYRKALRDAGVAPWRSTLMWAGVSLHRVFTHSSRARFVGLLAQAFASWALILGGLAVLATPLSLGLGDWDPVAALGAMLLPLAAAPAQGRAGKPLAITLYPGLPYGFLWLINGLFTVAERAFTDWKIAPRPYVEDARLPAWARTTKKQAVASTRRESVLTVDKPEAEPHVRTEPDRAKCAEEPYPTLTVSMTP